MWGVTGSTGVCRLRMGTWDLRWGPFLSILVLTVAKDPFRWLFMSFRSTARGESQAQKGSSLGFLAEPLGLKKVLIGL